MGGSNRVSKHCPACGEAYEDRYHALRADADGHLVLVCLDCGRERDGDRAHA